MLLSAAYLLNARGHKVSSNAALDAARWRFGVIPVLGASLLSGLSGAVTQKTLQVRGRNSYLLSCELAVFGIITLIATTIASGDSHRVSV